MFDSNWNDAAVASAIAVLLSGCASAHLDRSHLTEDIGRATHRDISLSVPEVLNRHGYAIREHWETHHVLYYETDWVPREPFEDEVGSRAREYRTRIIIRARKGGANTFGVTLQAENSARSMVPHGDWSPAPATDGFREHVRAVATDLVMEIDAGLRVR